MSKPLTTGSSVDSSPPPPVPPRRTVGAVVVGLTLVLVGAIALLATLGVNVPLAIVGPVVLMVLGLGVVVSAVRGESSGGAMGLAVFLAVVLALASFTGSVFDVPLRGSIGDVEQRPLVASELQGEYRVLMGSLEVDLRDLQLEPGTTELDLTTVLGEVTVHLPADVEVSVAARVGGGEATVFGITHEGLAVDNDQVTDGFEAAPHRLSLKVGVGLGDVVVTR